jgi:hypothetical protein
MTEGYPKYLGKHQRGDDTYTYYLYDNMYVYQMKNDELIGLYCSFPAWERTMHNVLNQQEVKYAS